MKKNNNNFEVNKAKVNYYKVLISTLFEVYLKKCKSEEEFNLCCGGIHCLSSYFNSKSFERGITFEEFMKINYS